MIGKISICPDCGSEMDYGWSENEYWLRCLNKKCEKFMWKDDFRKLEYEREIQKVLEKFSGNEYYNLDGDMEILYDEDKKWYLRCDSGYGKLEIKFRTVKNLIKDREDSYLKK